jgi:hypothetical protein
MRSLFFLAIVLSALSSASAGGALRRLRRTADAVQEAVHEKYLDLAALVTNGRTLQRVEERQNLRERKMIGMDKYDIMDAAVVDLYGLGLAAAPTAKPTEPRVVEAATELSMSMKILSMSMEASRGEEMSMKEMSMSMKGLSMSM